ncbi:MAG: 16S rRNA (cytidine(1402)-2'-O)-methyltransferase [Flavobacteriales bacterium]|jgi:16S rRNA (cytidine1402-2'-O)-methyltransferase|nr:16S rRNA (cytidine(1402)-2'-O)-methyltransferase [Flavobacteriales bacterium]|tara:strand:+ start:12121 stop:12792 length:672 start_codon:yes stop_codon:yes gene_type:complete
MEKVIHIIPTPIGNLEDITLRAINLLKDVDIILAEDTRTTKKLLNKYDITNKMISYHSFNEHKTLKNLIHKIMNGEQLALVSDAGTPGISDPGFLLIRECIKNNISINCLPGPTACIPALIQSGIPCDRFIFEGFLPVRKGRKTRLLNIINCKTTSIIYESPHRILKTLKELYQYCPDRQIVVLKELTKIHETTYRGSMIDIINILSQSKIKGEFIIILNGKN